MGVENYAVFTPYTEPINLVIFNSNGTTFKGNRTIAENSESLFRCIFDCN
jgi:hypothetical protein